MVVFYGVDKILVALILIVYAIYKQTSIFQILGFALLGGVYAVTAGWLVTFVVMMTGIGKKDKRKKTFFKNLLFFCFFMFINGIFMAFVCTKLVGSGTISSAINEPYYWVGAFVATNFQYYMAIVLNYE